MGPVIPGPAVIPTPAIRPVCGHALHWPIRARALAAAGWIVSARLRPAAAGLAEFSTTWCWVSITASAPGPWLRPTALTHRCALPAGCCWRPLPAAGPALSAAGRTLLAAGTRPISTARPLPLCSAALFLSTATCAICTALSPLLLIPAAGRFVSLLGAGALVG